MKCLKRALKWAHAAQQQAQAALKASDVEPVSLLVEILNHYAYYFDQGLKTITTNVLQVNPTCSTLCRWILDRVMATVPCLRHLPVGMNESPAHG